MNTTDPSTEEIIKDLGPAAKLFSHGSIPSVIRVASKYGYGKVLGHLLAKSFPDNPPIDKVVVEGLISIALFHCDNMYCYVIHSNRLLNLGISQSQISYLLKTLEFPDSVPDTEKWNRILRLTFFTYKDKGLTIRNLESVRSALSQEEYQHYSAVLALTAHLEFLISVYFEEIQVRSEPLFRDDEGELKKDIARFVKYYEEIREKIHPVVVICQYCKDVKDTETDLWHKVESVISKLPPDSIFSHGTCDNCIALHVASSPFSKM